jgi:membrane protein DedA with SNARE-associated domain
MAWSAVFTTIGYLFGPAVDRILAALAPHRTELLIALPIPGACLLAWLLWRRRRQKIRERRNPPFHAPAIESEG